jgi:hypothetical protein
MLENLIPNTKLDLKSQLTLNVKTIITKKGDRFYISFGAWESKQSADQIGKEIAKSRRFKCQIER